MLTQVSYGAYDIIIILLHYHEVEQQMIQIVQCFRIHVGNVGAIHT